MGAFIAGMSAGVVIGGAVAIAFTEPGALILVSLLCRFGAGC